jgi:hypothetical protein
MTSDATHTLRFVNRARAAMGRVRDRELRRDAMASAA